MTPTDLSISLIGHLMYLLSTCSYMVRDIIWLRGLAMAASITEIVYSTFAMEYPQYWVPIGWNVAFLAINSYHIIWILNQTAKLKFSPEEQELYETTFQNLSQLEFMKLLRIAKWCDKPSGTVIAQEGENLKFLYFLYNGQVGIEIGGEEVAQLRDGHWIGEMSFMTEAPASATVTTQVRSIYLRWDKAEIRALMDRNPALLTSIQSLLGLDMAKKLQGNSPNPDSAVPEP